MNVLIADQVTCTCGHKSISHGRTGECGIDRDTRNAATGYEGDPCPCMTFTARAMRPAHRMPQATDSTWSPQILTGSDARALRADDTARESRATSALRSASLNAHEYETLSTARDRVARLEVARAAAKRAERPARLRRALTVALVLTCLTLGAVGLWLTAQIPGIG